MPYINKRGRKELDLDLQVNPRTPGTLNYCITKLLNAYLNNCGPITYTAINDVIGVLECAKQEFYRRIAIPYEDKKKIENGDVY